MRPLAAFLVALAAAAPLAAQSQADPPLVAAVKSRDASALKSLLASGADVGAKDRYGWTATMWAVGRADPAVVSALLAAGGDPAPAGFRPMVEAAKGGNAGVVRLLAARRFSCRAQDDLGVSAVSYSATLASTDTAKALLDCGADPNAADSHGTTPLMRAVQSGKTAAAALLLSRGAKPDLRDAQGYTALMWAARDGKTALVRALLAARADPRVKALDGSTAREIAVRRRRDEAAALLPAP
jgi:ankyrin repeat protein